MEIYFGRILVEDASGVRLYVHEYRGRRSFLPVRRFVLDTGEPIRALDSATFEVEATGERLLRVRE